MEVEVVAGEEEGTVAGAAGERVEAGVEAAAAMDSGWWVGPEAGWAVAAPQEVRLGAAGRAGVGARVAAARGRGQPVRPQSRGCKRPE